MPTARGGVEAWQGPCAPVRALSFAERKAHGGSAACARAAVAAAAWQRRAPASSSVLDTVLYHVCPLATLVVGALCHSKDESA
jgi:hypothetical protein